MTDGIALFLVLLFLLSAYEKAQVLVARTAAWHPLLNTRSLTRRFAPLLMAASLVADVSVAAALVFLPRAGALLSVCALIAYSTVAIIRSDVSYAPCRCFGRFFEAPGRSFLLARNALLAGLALVVVAGARQSAIQLSASAIPTTALLVGLLVSGAWVLRVRRHTIAISADD